MFNLECFFFYISSFVSMRYACRFIVAHLLARRIRWASEFTLAITVTGSVGASFQRGGKYTHKHTYIILCVCSEHSYYSFLSIPLDAHQTTTELRRKSRYLQRSIRFLFTTKFWIQKKNCIGMVYKLTSVPYWNEAVYNNTIFPVYRSKNII